ncbi:MAG TPA: TatD family hydrolase [Candidatus Olsenella pullistercoris]|uniref:TatD family hydrolase n=1 Tax=Candidatus Olsenella pullistercoris TaxID=2838712 RepID=A0A9D2F0Q3_9ACTN|nr:TatD family hydrolase [Candidatus Olsenella pullistercoris]
MPEKIALDDLTLADHELFHDRKGAPRPLPAPLAPLADTHGHLTSFRAHDPAMALVRAALAGVRLLVVPVDAVDDVPRRWGSAPELLDWIDEQVEVAREALAECAEEGFVPPAFDGWGAPELLDNVRIVAGVHPYGAEQLDDEAMARLRELLASPRCVGVGEFGLDLGPYSKVPREVQEDAFRRQLRLAHELDLPVQLHVRATAGDMLSNAYVDAARILRDEGVPERGCDLHCFTAGVQVMENFASLGCHIAFGGAATFTRSDDIREAAAFCAERRLLTETDSPYMAPVPLRGEECEPAMVAFSAACVADVRERASRGSREATYRALWENACALFGR